ncbi:hypothetical protein BRADI_5g23063v3 [Brachypodium distachyon]|uniref:Uncharacterized protein n=1 Tax=Brachypodium distachyon TaxID=15368 RepID=A0A2K2CIT0_BRADI|nr:hypothetical protein BRADI_5g23063v3 [Brachypodium distachyon]PNT61931.1 hypothetical protein BRADI_5g23063v3 [Brachypodium distachyon]PNT61932.1 hypothetical protein BRADI_5g23063v3 [Brachypodium distachyon]PNT61933.1 hypothetical protein BRADI_5g23063v3 [Brachypodium distachyon]
MVFSLYVDHKDELYSNLYSDYCTLECMQSPEHNKRRCPELGRGTAATADAQQAQDAADQQSQDDAAQGQAGSKKSKLPIRRNIILADAPAPQPANALAARKKKQILKKNLSSSCQASTSPSVALSGTNDFHGVLPGTFQCYKYCHMYAFQ